MDPWRVLKASAVTVMLGAMACGDGTSTSNGSLSTASSALSQAENEREGNCVFKHEQPLCNIAALGDPGDDMCKNLCVNVNFVGGGSVVPAGGPWTPFINAVVNTKNSGAPFVYPSDYNTNFPEEPIKDFLFKFKEYRIVVDPGTKHEREYIYKGEDLKEIITVKPSGEVFAYFASLDPTNPLWNAIGAFFINVQHPLAVGVHQITQYWTMSDLQCDGFGVGIGAHCVPAGESNVTLLFGGTPFFEITVVPH